MTLTADDFVAAARVLGEERARETERPSFWRRRR